jgi:hypothetical protein
MSVYGKVHFSAHTNHGIICSNLCNEMSLSFRTLFVRRNIAPFLLFTRRDCHDCCDPTTADAILMVEIHIKFFPLVRFFCTSGLLLAGGHIFTRRNSIPLREVNILTVKHKRNNRVLYLRKSYIE